MAFKFQSTKISIIILIHEKKAKVQKYETIFDIKNGK